MTERKDRETGRGYAFRMLRDNRIHLELKLASMVSEKEAADEMGISRTPFREALLGLQAKIPPEKLVFMDFSPYL